MSYSTTECIEHKGFIMKKSLLIIPITFALAACGGGGGSSGPGTIINNPNPATYWGQVLSGDTKQTLQNSTAGINVRGGTTVRFDTADNAIVLRNTDWNDGFEVQLSLSDFNSETGRGAIERTFTRSDMTLYHTHGVLFRGNHDMRNQQATHLTEVHEVKLSGTATGLQYGEFGYWRHSFVFWNGSQRLTPENDTARGDVFVLPSNATHHRATPTGNATFTGDAFGMMQRWLNPYYANVAQGTATLVVNGGQQNITADFGDWGVLNCVDCANASSLTFRDATLNRFHFSSQFLGSGADATEVVGRVHGQGNIGGTGYNIDVSFGAIRQ